MEFIANNVVHINSPVVRPCWKQIFVIPLHSEPGENQASHGGGSLGCSVAVHLSCLTGEPQQDSCRVLSVCPDQHGVFRLCVCVCSDKGAQGTEEVPAGPGSQRLLQHLPASCPASPSDAPGAWIYFSLCLFLKDSSFYTPGSLQI